MSSSPKLTRRSFLASGLALAAGGTAACLPEVDGEWPEAEGTVCTPSAATVTPPAPAQAGRVIELAEPALVATDGGAPRIVEAEVAGGLSRLLRALTAAPDLKAAWSRLLPDYQPGQVVGIKVNTLNRNVPTHLEVVRPLVTSLRQDAGVPGEAILVWDRRLDELTRAGLTAEALGCRVEGTTDDAQVKGEGRGYELSPTCIGGQTAHLSNIQTRAVDHLINLAVLKNHFAAGFTGVLKNHYGTIDSPGAFHDRTGAGGVVLEPWFARAIPAINALDEVAGTTRLWLIDATLAVARGDTDGAADCMPAALLGGLDPVALDVRGRQIRDEMAQGAVQDTISDGWLEAAEQVGLGQRKLTVEKA